MRVTDIDPATILMCALKRPTNAAVPGFMQFGIELARRAALGSIDERGHRVPNEF